MTMGIKNEVTNVLKTSSTLRKVYYKLGSGLLKSIGTFVRRDDKLVLFNSFGGRRFDDSPKALFDYMKKDERFQGYKFVWAFHEPEKFDVPGAEVIKTDTVEYFRTAMKAHLWITNSGIERGLFFKKKGTVYLNTWHGTPIKYMGSDALKIEPSKMPKRNYDLQNAQSMYEAEIFSRTYCIPMEKMLVCGYPRNDILINNDADIQKEYKRKLGIPIEKTVILYAPTFRDYDRDAALNCFLKPPIHFDTWKEELGEEYVVLMRCHYEVAKLLGVDIDGDFVRDVSDYPTLNDLMLASDMLISDYSSIIFDYAILKRPIVVYTYDYDTYNKKRGIYIDVRETFDGGSVSEEELLQIIKNLDREQNIEKVEAFRSKYVTEYGNATEKTVNAVWDLTRNR